MTLKERLAQRAMLVRENFKSSPEARKLLYKIILIVVYAGIAIFDIVSYGVFVQDATFGVIVTVVAAFIGVIVASYNPPDVGTLLSYVLTIAFIFLLLPWVLFASPWAPTIKTYMTRVGDSITAAIAPLGTLWVTFNQGIACATSQTSEACLAASQPPGTQESNLGLEIKAVTTEGFAYAEQETSLIVSLKNEGHRAGRILSFVFNFGRNPKITTVKDGALLCDGCASGVVGDAVAPRDVRDITARHSVVCMRKETSEPYNITMVYSYAVNGSTIVDVLKKETFETKLAQGDFRMPVMASSTSGPVSASIYLGSDNLQPMKGGSKTTVFVKLTNTGTGKFRFTGGKVVLPETSAGEKFLSSECKLRGTGVDLGDIAARSEWYKPNEYVLITCSQTSVPDVEDRFVATVSASYEYEYFRSGSITLDQTSVTDVCSCKREGFVCKTNKCDTYDQCAKGDEYYCDTGNCCEGACTDKPTQP